MFQICLFAISLCLLLVIIYIWERPYLFNYSSPIQSHLFCLYSLVLLLQAVFHKTYFALETERSTSFWGYNFSICNKWTHFEDSSCV